MKSAGSIFEFLFLNHSEPHIKIELKNTLFTSFSSEIFSFWFLYPAAYWYDGPHLFKL